MTAIQWTYNDWRRSTYSTDQSRLDRLVLHIEEVESYVIEASSKGRSSKLPPEYLQQLEAERLRLQDRIDRKTIASNIGSGRVRVRFGG